MENKMQKDLSIELILTHSCNFRCRYCYEKDSPYKRSVLKKVVKAFPKFVRDMQKCYNSREIVVTFFGGEPSLRSDDIIYVTHDLMYEPWSKFVIITNGYDIEKLKSLLLEVRDKTSIDKFIIQVSYDYGVNQERNRREAKTLDGVSTKKKVYNNILWLSENKLNVTIKPTIDIEGLAYIEDAYFDYRNVLSEIQKRFPNINFTIKETLDTYGTDAISEEILNKFRQGMMNIIKYQIKNNIHHDFNWLKPDMALCSVGANMVCVDIDGSLYPCHGAPFAHNKDMHKLPFTVFDYDCSKLLRNDIYGQDPDSECAKCYAINCSRCNIHSFDRSDKENYEDRMRDYSCNHSVSCQIHKEISKFIYAKSELMKQLN